MTGERSGAHRQVRVGGGAHQVRGGRAGPQRAQGQGGPPYKWDAIYIIHIIFYYI